MDCQDKTNHSRAEVCLVWNMLIYKTEWDFISVYVDWELLIITYLYCFYLPSATEIVMIIANVGEEIMLQMNYVFYEAFNSTDEDILITDFIR